MTTKTRPPQITLASSKALFSTPLLVFKLPDHERLNVALEGDALELKALEPGKTKSNQGGWHSETDIFERDIASFLELRDAVRQAVVTASRKVLPTPAPEEMKMIFTAWVNINGTGSFNAPHNHPNSHWSGSYYVKVPEGTGMRSGDIEFLDPRGDVRAMSLPDGEPFGPKLRIRPEPGFLLMFPSYLHHWVYPNQEPEDRISIAFNVKLVTK